MTLEALAQGRWLAAHARIIVELGATDDLDLPAGYTLERERRYGSAKFLFLRHASGATVTADPAAGPEP